MNTSGSSKKTIPAKIHDVLLVEKPVYKKLVRFVWIIFLCFLLGIPLFIISVNYNFLGLYGPMPSLAAIENPENDLSSELLSGDGVSLGRYFRHNRSQATFAELSPHLVNTLLYSEDHRFYEHSGMDFVAFFRVLWGQLTLNPAGGGSTITQQLAKNLFTQNSEISLDGKIAEWIHGGYPIRIIQKIKEWIISVYLEKNFTKEEIISMYLNTSEFGSNSYGIKVAAETYFNKPVDSLNIQESAVLVGILQRVTIYNPYYYPENSLSKRNEVLNKLYVHHYIKTKPELDSIKALPIELDYKVQNQNEGIATYMRSVITNELLGICKELNIDLYESGLKIYTTIDSRVQQYLEEAVAEHMKELQAKFDESWKGKNPWIDNDKKEIRGFLETRAHQTEAWRNLVAQYGKDSDSVKIMFNLKRPMQIFSWDGEKDTLFSSWDSLNYYKRFLNTGAMVLDPETGAVLAWVGGINHKYFKYDHVKQGKRQPGSTFKPFVYGFAMEQEFNPCELFQDVVDSYVIPGHPNWSPPNADGPPGGTGEWMTLRQAMARSKNSITAKVMYKIGPQNVVNFAHRVGIESKLQPVMSLCLGVNDVSLFEMVGAYGTFVNHGIHTAPFYITKIEDRHGNVLKNFVPSRKQAMSEQNAYKMIFMLRGGVEEEGGTSAGLAFDLKEGNQLGGKTGTTNNASDGWYIGVDHNLVIGAWVGGDEPTIHFRDWIDGQGSRTARPIFEKTLRKIYADETLPYKKGNFPTPQTGINFNMDCSRYMTSDSVEVQKTWETKDLK